MKKLILLAAIAFMALLVTGCVREAQPTPSPSPSASPTVSPSPSPSGDAELDCVNSGGTVTTGLCCGQTGDFPNSCLIGACGCAPWDSHEVKTCDCGEGKCFDGSRCVPHLHV